MATIPVSEVSIGMYVVELDRPWEGTPFLLQGFLVSTAEEVAQLRRLCREVKIDRSLSQGEHYRERVIEKDPPRQFAPRLGIETEHNVTKEGARFIRAMRAYRGKIHTERPAQRPAVDDYGHSVLLEEMEYSAPVVDDVFRALHESQSAIDRGQNLDTARLHSLVDEMAEGVQRNADAMMWLLRLKRTDRYAYDHAVSVSVHAMLFASCIGIDEYQVRQLGFASLMQDIGKLKVNHEILMKAGPLNKLEREFVRLHVQHAVTLLQQDPRLDRVMLEIIATHHERYDGSGYPRGLKGEQIPLLGEIAGMVDSYCAMTRKRSYAEAISSQGAMEEINRLRDTGFRDALVDQFLQCIGLYPVGTMVELNSGEVGVVIQQNQVRRLQPKLLIILDEYKKVEPYPRTLNLLMLPETRSGESYRILRALPQDAYGIKADDFFLQ